MNGEYIGGEKMREIKFRGKRIDNGEWIYGNCLELEHNDDKTHKHFCIMKQPALEHPVEKTTYEVFHETVGQFTGCLIGGLIGAKELYQDDLFESGSAIIQVIWDAEYFQWAGKIIKGDNCLTVGLAFPLWQYIKEKKIKEILGNIHDNLKLLEVTK